METNKNEIIEKLRTFAETYGKTHSVNVSDFRVSKNVASGRGEILNSSGAVINKDKIRCSSNILEPIVNSIVYKFTETPFDFKSPEGQDSGDFKNLKFQLSSCLRDCVQDGLSYLLIYQKDGELKYKKLINYNVIYGRSDYGNGRGVKEVVYCDKKDIGHKAIGIKHGGLKTTFETVIEMGPNEVPLLTYYERDENGVHTYMFENDELVDESHQELSEIPIVRIYARELPINDEPNWRGFYYLVDSNIRIIDQALSLWQERMNVNSTFLYWVSEEALGSSGEKYSKVNDIPTAFRTYRAFDPNNPGVKLDPPIKNDLKFPMEDLMQTIQDNERQVNSKLGNVAGMGLENETAEAVLMRRESKEAATNDILKNLLDSTNRIADIIQEFTGIKYTVVADIFEKMKLQEEFQKIIAICTIVNQNPAAAQALPIILAKSDLSIQSQNQLLQLINQPNPLVQQLQQENAQLNDQLRTLSINQENQMTQAVMNHELGMNRMALDAEVEGARLELEWAKLDKDSGEAQAKLMVDVEKIQTEYRIKKQEVDIKTAKYITEDKNG